MMSQQFPAASNTMISLFIKTFFIEQQRTLKKPLNELTHVTFVLDILFNKFYGVGVTNEVVFKTFVSLGYSIAVIEPRQASKIDSPYIDTNSGAIHINLDPLMIKKLEYITVSDMSASKILNRKSSKLLLELRSFPNLLENNR